MNQVLYISYDGLTDPLGTSQILPYIEGLHGEERRFTVLSFEKPERLESRGPLLRRRLAESGIVWVPLRFTRRPKYLSKGWDLLRMYLWATWLVVRKRITIVHCRSYQAGQVGWWLKRVCGTRLLFDMRGLWADERVDGGLWDPSRFFPGLLYRAYRGIERQLLACADQIVTLTQRSLPILRGRAPDRSLPVTVIPCCADFEHFQVCPPEVRERRRRELAIPPGVLVLGYLGSLGTWYRLSDMCRLFRALLGHHPESYFLILTQDWSSECETLWQSLGLGPYRDRLVIRPAHREEIPELLATVDISVSFITPSFSKQASSPTKMAETLACGIPMICNAGVGDVDEQLRVLDAGLCLPDFNEATLEQGAEQVKHLLRTDRKALRERSRQLFDLTLARQSYGNIYQKLEASGRGL